MPGEPNNAMAFQPTENGLRLILNWDATQMGRFTNHIWFARPSYTQQDVIDLAEAIDETDFETLVGPWHQSVSLTSIALVDEREQGAPQVIVNVNQLGNASGELLPISLCLCVTLRTSLRGRSYRGRFYAGGLSETNQQDGMWNQAVITPILDFIQHWRDFAVQEGWNMGVRSGQINGVPRAEAIVVPIIHHEVRSPIVTHQRRRVRRV